jgi:hypothetical protein
MQPHRKANGSCCPFTLESGHEITDVRLTADFVRFTPNSGHYSGTPICPFLTHNGHARILARRGWRR